MLTHSLELALQEADGGFHDEQLLQRANVSPFFSSASSAEPAHSSLSRASSLCDFSLDNDCSPSLARPQERATTSDPRPCANPWDLFLEGKTPHGGPITYALKTPTPQSFSSFFPDEDSTDPTALSPTHIDKKVLVSDHDLKLGAVGYEPNHKWDVLVDTTSRSHGKHSQPPSRRAHTTQRKVFPLHNEPYVDVPIRPRRALLSGPPVRARYDPYSGVSPRHARFALADEDECVVPRLPALSVPSPCVFPLVDQNWRRGVAMQEPSHSQVTRDAPRRPPPVDTLSPYAYAAIFRSLPTNAQSARPTKSSRTLSGNSKRKIGIYTPEARRERVRRFHDKRKHRVFRKRTQYDCRQRLANACPRVKGRFVRKQPPLQDNNNADDAKPPGDDIRPPHAA